MNCKEYLKSLDYDETDPIAVIEVLKQTLAVEEFVPEQILFCVGYIMDKNKEKFIKKLKQECSEAKIKFHESEDKIKSLELKLNETIEKPKVAVEQPKKKVVVVRKKNG